MIECDCGAAHRKHWIVLTGGPGAGKTAVLEMIRKSFCEHVRVLPESAGIVFGGGFPRESDPVIRRAAQRAIYHVQRELEATVEHSNAAVVLCDRGTVDGVAYWPGPDDFWSAVSTTLDAELSRYDAAIHLRTPSTATSYNHRNPLRIETHDEAAAVDESIAAAWASHPRRFEVGESEDFLTKAGRVLAIIRDEVPACCRAHAVLPHELDGSA